GGEVHATVPAEGRVPLKRCGGVDASHLERPDPEDGTDLLGVHAVVDLDATEAQLGGAFEEGLQVALEARLYGPHGGKRGRWGRLDAGRGHEAGVAEPCPASTSSSSRRVRSSTSS